MIDLAIPAMIKIGFDSESIDCAEGPCGSSVSSSASEEHPVKNKRNAKNETQNHEVLKLEKGFNVQPLHVNRHDGQVLCDGSHVHLQLLK